MRKLFYAGKMKNIFILWIVRGTTETQQECLSTGNFPKEEEYEKITLWALWKEFAITVYLKDFLLE